MTHGGSSIAGSILGVTVNSSSVNSVPPGCTPSVSLYTLSSDGSKITPASATTTLNDDGSFQFQHLNKNDFNPAFSKLQYLIEADPCTGDLLSRFVSGQTAQDISYGSTLLSYIPAVNFVSKPAVTSVAADSAETVASLLNALSTSDLVTSYQAGLNDPTTTASFQSVFGFAFSDLQYSMPTVSSVTHPNSVDELSAVAFATQASHWNPDVTLAYKWKINGVTKSTTANLNWTPGKNDQGLDAIDLYIGFDTIGDGSLDVAKSFSHFTYSLTVNNIYPAIPPALSLTSAAVTNSQSTTLSLTTGTVAGSTFSNCQSFSKLIFTESTSSAALTLPSSADFSSPDAFTCASAGTQAQNFTLSSGDGNHTLALWAEDSSGNITTVPTAVFVNVTLDQTSPVVGALSVPSVLAGGGTAPIAYSASDATSGLSSVILYYADDGSTFSQVADLTAGVSPYSWTVPSDDTTTAKLRLIAIDNAGNSTTVDSNTFTVDSTAPSALTLAFTTPADFGTTSASLALSKTAANSVSVTGCSGDATKMFFKEVDTTEGTAPTTPTAPTSTDVGWISCAATSTWTVVTGDGEKSYFAWAMDAAGNISSASTALTFVLDQTSPTLSLTSFNSANLAVAGGTSQLITWNASDAHFSATPIKIEYTLDGTIWVSVTAAASNASNSGCTVPGGSSGCYSWAVPSVDSSSNPIDLTTAKIKITVTDTPGNPQIAQTGVDFSIRSSGPVLSSMTINDGATYAGTTLINAKVALSDHGFSTIGMKVVLNQAATPTSDCELPTTPVWLSWGGASSNISYQLSTANGTKKICAWAKNSAGLTSQASTFTCTSGVDCNSIDLEIGSPPVISTFTVSSSGGFTAPAGSTINISWAAAAQGILKLDNDPISFAYTTDNTTWYDVGTNKDLSTMTDTSEQNPATQVMTWYGGLSGNPVTGSGTMNFTSPSNGFARLRAVARDTAGNFSIVAYSNIFNTTMANGGVWQIYAGSTDRGDGGSATSASLYDNGAQESLVVDPRTGDIYARDATAATSVVRKLNVKTGQVSTFIKTGTLNLSTNGGALPSQILGPSASGSTRLAFGKDGMLYYHPGNGNYPIYKIDLVAGTSAIYAGGGMAYDSDSNPLNIFVQITSPLAIDEDNTLYFYADCIPSAPSSSRNPVRLMKVTQNSDGSAGPAVAVAGNCQYGSLSASGTLAASTVFGPANFATPRYFGQGAIVPVNHGQTIYICNASNPFLKIVNDGTQTRLYRATSGVAPHGLSYNSIDGFVYGTSLAAGVFKYTPTTAAADGGETYTTVVAPDGTGSNCLDDGIGSTQTCVVSDVSPAFDSSGTVYFTDGMAANMANGYRVRYLDSSSNVHTAFGSLPFFGNGLQKELIRGQIYGIYYKNSSSSPANATAFPNGLYFSSPSMVFGYINPTTGLYSTIWGNQQNNANITTLAGTTASSSVPMGTAYTGGAGYALTFDDNGHPWLRSHHTAVTLDDDLKIQLMGTDSTDTWNTRSPSTDPHMTGLHNFGGSQNFTMAGNSLFLIGAYQSIDGTHDDPTPQIRMLDFTNNIQPIILGNGYTFSQNMTTPTSVAVGDGTTTPIANSPLNFNCTNNANCQMQYVSSSDTLYFSDLTTQIHYITHPQTPTTSTLGTLALTAPFIVSNFIVKPDESQIFYTTNNGAGGLYCYPLTPSGVTSWCPSSGTVQLYGYYSQMKGFGNSPNKFTWMDSENLLISTGAQVLQFTLPTGP